MKKMVIGQLSARHVSGPITIAKYAGQTANLGFQQFLNFMALISISLGVLNLLPIPILDGGHILYCIAEIIHGKPLSTSVQNAGFWLGGLVLFCFMFLAFYNDFTMILQ
jgi:regulator of sigma E protease